MMTSRTMLRFDRHDADSANW